MTGFRVKPGKSETIENVLNNKVDIRPTFYWS